MPPCVTFLHAADLHIGAPFRGVRALSPAWADRLRDAVVEAYDRVIDVALERSVDFVVIAGDVFDQARAAYADYVRFFHGLKRLADAGIPTYLVTGNHDPLSRWQQDFFTLPDGARILAADRPDFALYERNGEPVCIIAGRSFAHSVWPADENIAEGLTRTEAERVLGPHAAAATFGVGVLHTGLSYDSAKAPVNPAELLRAGFDYWALGHIHQPLKDSEENPRLVYSGCIQGRDIKETGARGVNVVTLSEGQPNRVEFVPTARVVWQRYSVDATSCDTVPALADAIMTEQFSMCGLAQCENMISRITLLGTTSLHDVLARPGVLDDLQKQLNERHEGFFVDALVDKTARPVDRAALRAEGLFPAVFLQIADELRASPEAQAAYLQEEFLARNIALPASALDRIDQLAAEAENLVLDLLVQEAE